MAQSDRDLPLGSLPDWLTQGQEVPLASFMTHYGPDPLAEEAARRLRQAGQNLWNTYTAPIRAAKSLTEKAATGTLFNPLTDDPSEAKETAGEAFDVVGGIAGARMPFAKAGELGATGGKLPAAAPDILPRNLGPARPNRPINPQTLAEMRELQQSLPAPPVTRPINEQTLAEMRGAEAPKPTPSIQAYHGSPHDFDRFDLSKIGTGEGAQAYGHGLYFAENEGVARDYKTKLAGGNDPMIAMAKDALNRANGDGAVAAKQLRTGMFQDRPGVAELADKLASGWKPEGKMYQVSIKADPEHFLDWDRLPSEQSEQIRQRLKSLGADPAKYSNIQTMMDDLGDPAKPGYDQAAISDKLRAAGIPGIKYLDQGSRAGGEGTRNYVVFDDKLIDILKKYGLAGLAALPALNAMQSRPVPLTSLPAQQ